MFGTLAPGSPMSPTSVDICAHAYTFTLKTVCWLQDTLCEEHKTLACGGSGSQEPFLSFLLGMEMNSMETELFTSLQKTM